eukprot:scaffold28911_cov62-Phaeocystis_antarctica.AAC.5
MREAIRDAVSSNGSSAAMAVLSTVPERVRARARGVRNGLYELADDKGLYLVLAEGGWPAVGWGGTGSHTGQPSRREWNVCLRSCACGPPPQAAERKAALGQHSFFERRVLEVLVAQQLLGEEARVQLVAPRHVPEQLCLEIRLDALGGALMQVLVGQRAEVGLGLLRGEAPRRPWGPRRRCASSRWPRCVRAGCAAAAPRRGGRAAPRARRGYAR